jgi:hypothetical protein
MLFAWLHGSMNACLVLLFNLMEDEVSIFVTTGSLKDLVMDIAAES